MRQIPMFSHRLLLVVLATVTLLVSTGCTHVVVVAPSPPYRSRIDVLPLDVGLYLSKEFRGYEVAEHRKGDKWHYANLGAASATQMQRQLARAFRTVELVDERPPFTRSPNTALSAVIEPAIERFDFDIPLTNLGTFPARIRYNLTVYDMAGTVILSRTVQGEGEIRRIPAQVNFSENPSIAATAAIEDGAAKALRAILEAEELKALVKP